MSKSEPHDWESGHDAPLGYHLTLLRDPHRMAAYERAIRVLVDGSSIVLDVGAGTGVLSMLAARAGAARVHGVESMPIGGLAKQLAYRNGLEQVTIHRADVREMKPVEPVDILISECLGRFLVDDGMIPAMEAGMAWLKPDGRCCPSDIELFLAPAGGFHLDVIDDLGDDFYGLDFSPALSYAFNTCYDGAFRPEVLLSEPSTFCHWNLPGPCPPLAKEFSFVVERGGEMRALLGWFRATLAPGVVLDTRPGVQTHWGQYIFPIHAVDVVEGDRVTGSLVYENKAPQRWTWTGQVSRADSVVAEFDHESLQRMGKRQFDEPEGTQQDMSKEALLALNERGAEAFRNENYEEAVSIFEQCVRSLRPQHSELAANIFENLGLANSHRGRHRAALRAYLRALDGDLVSREQSLRFAINELFTDGRAQDGERFLRVYEEAFGPHPAGWRRT